MKEGNIQNTNEYNNLAIIGFILAFILPPVGFILGIIALSQIKQTNEKGRGLSIAAIVLGAIFFLFWLMMIFVGLSWIFIRNIVYEDSYELNSNNIDALCFEANVEVTEVVKNSDKNYAVTILRNGGNYPLGGVKLVFVNSNTDEQEIKSIDLSSSSLKALDSEVLQVTTDYLDNPTQVSVVPYFLDDSGNEQLCSTANDYIFE